MASEKLPEPIDIDDMPDLRAVVSRMAKGPTPIVLRCDGREIATIAPIQLESRPKKRRVRHRPISADSPLWDMVGIGSSDEPTDIAKYKDEYLAEAYADLHDR